MQWCKCFHPGRKTDRKRSFLYDDCRQRAEGRDSYKFYQTVLCGDAICATRVDDPAGNRRPGGAGGMAV